MRPHFFFPLAERRNGVARQRRKDALRRGCRGSPRRCSTAATLFLHRRFDSASHGRCRSLGCFRGVECLNDSTAFFSFERRTRFLQDDKAPLVFDPLRRFLPLFFVSIWQRYHLTHSLIIGMLFFITITKCRSTARRLHILRIRAVTTARSVRPEAAAPTGAALLLGTAPSPSDHIATARSARAPAPEIGRASCRERVYSGV